jgi:hypothetical protein
MVGPSQQVVGEGAYRVGSVAGALEVRHAVQAGIRCAIALVAVAVELLLGKDIPTVLFAAVRSQRPLIGSSAACLQGGGVQSGSWARLGEGKRKHTSQENDTMAAEGSNEQTNRRSSAGRRSVGR